MKRRNAEFQTLSVSFLDAISNALGAVLLLLVCVMTTSESSMRATQNDRDNARRQLSQLQNDRDDARRQLSQMQKELKAFVGLRGVMQGVVFIFDTSGSMDNEHFPEYIDLLKRWVLSLSFEQFNVIQFNSDVTVWSEGGMRPGTVENRRAALAFIDTFKPQKLTNTLEAMKRAFAMQNVDTIILFTDGSPVLFRDGKPVTGDNGKFIFGDRPMEQVRQWLRDHNTPRRVIVNTVATGDYVTDVKFGEFLRTIARENGGEFIGR
jgi:hypothetical protein